MADPIDDVVTVTITPSTVNPTRLGFGSVLLYGHHTRFPELTRRYADISDMISDGFLVSDELYRMANKIKTQNPSVVEFVVGRKPTAPSFTESVTITSAVEGQHVQLKALVLDAGTLTDPVVTGGVISPTGALTAGTVVTIDYTIQAAATLTSVAAAVESLIEAIPGIASSAAVAVITVTPVTAGKRPHLYDLVNATGAETTADAGYADELAALQLEDDDWYFLVIDSGSEANILDVAAWAESSERPKLFFAEVSNTAVTSTPLDEAASIGAALALDAYTRTATTFAFDSDDHVGAAYVGMGAPEAPGSITWHNQRLIGVTAKPLTTTQKNALRAANMNYYITIRGASVTQGGIVASGEYIDVIHGLDALKADIQESVLSVLIGKNKVPFTKSGFTVIEGAMLGALKRFEPADAESGSALLVFGSSVVLMPDIALVSPADKAARRLRNVKFTAQLAGAIHSVQIIGTVNL